MMSFMRGVQMGKAGGLAGLSRSAADRGVAVA